MKLRAGYVAFIPPGEPEQDTILKESLIRASWVANEIVVVWGRFRGREDLPPRPPPGYLERFPLSVGAKVKVIYSDLKLPQHEQRDLYLDGLEEGDILMVMDADWIPVYSAIPQYPSTPGKVAVRKYLFKDQEDWDSLLVDILYPDGKKQCSIICVYRYRPGMRHGLGQLLELDGKPIASPEFQVLPASPGFFYVHVKKEVK